MLVWWCYRFICPNNFIGLKFCENWNFNLKIQAEKYVFDFSLNFRSRTVETTTYEYENNGETETRVEQKVIIQSNGEPINHDEVNNFSNFHKKFKNSIFHFKIKYFIFILGIGTSYSRSHCHESRHDRDEDWIPLNHTSRQLVKKYFFHFRYGIIIYSLSKTNGFKWLVCGKIRIYTCHFPRHFP